MKHWQRSLILWTTFSIIHEATRSFYSYLAHPQEVMIQLPFELFEFDRRRSDHNFGILQRVNKTFKHMGRELFSFT